MKSNKSFIYFFVLFASLIGPHCKSTQTSKSEKAMYRSIYIDQFKLTYFRQLLIKGYNNSKAIQEIIKADHSGFTEHLLTIDDYRIIDSLTSVDNQKIKADSISRIGRVAEGAAGNHTLGYILNKLESKWLDSMANKRYKNSGVKKMYND